MMPFNEIRKHYEREMPAMMAEYKSTGNMVHDPYQLDFTGYSTHIEDYAWQAIRGYGVPMFPQFPVLNFFIDYANPFKKIGIECDGKQWHDPVKDAKRDAKLEAQGWTIYRIEGWKCKKIMAEPWESFLNDDGERFNFENPMHLKYAEEWFTTTSDGIILSIGLNHFENGFALNENYWRFIEQTLSMHRTTS